MPEPSSRPSADDLGISDVEYERILRDMVHRGQISPEIAAPLTAPTLQPSYAAPPQRRQKRWAFIAFALVLAVTLGPRLGLGGHGAPAYAFMHTVDGRPVTYSSCHPVQVAVYPAGGPPDAEALVREAVDQLRGATGLDIVVTGVFGGYAPNWNFEAAPVTPDDPISISWQDGAAIAEMTDHIAGLGGSRIITGPRGDHLGAGTIALSRDYYRELTGRQDHAEELAVLLHEFGHVLGLAHVNSPHELMYKKNIGRKSFGAGDLEGLRRLGQGPCT